MWMLSLTCSATRPPSGGGAGHPARWERAVPSSPQPGQPQRQHRDQHTEGLTRRRRRRHHEARRQRTEQVQPDAGRDRSLQEEHAADDDVVPSRRAGQRDSERPAPDDQRDGEQSEGDPDGGDIERLDAERGRERSHRKECVANPRRDDDPAPRQRIPRGHEASVSAVLQGPGSGDSAPRSPRVSGSKRVTRRSYESSSTARRLAAVPKRVRSASSRRSRSSAARAPTTSRGSTTSPLSPCTTASSAPPLRPATAGTPHAAASTKTIPNPSASK